MHCTPPFYSINRSGSKHDAGTNLIPFCLCTGVDYEKILRAESEQDAALVILLMCKAVSMHALRRHPRRGCASHCLSGWCC